MVKRKSIQFCILLTGVVLVSLGAFAQDVDATALGVNYYHETMMTDTWKTLYFPVSEGQVREDMRDIKSISNHIKLYMNPFVDGNREWVSRVVDIARAEGLHVAVNLQVDDRQLSGENWGEYRSRAMEACRTFNGRAETMMVANEVSLHSPMSKYEIRSKVEPLIEECKTVFNGEVSYSGFWFEKEAWYDYKKPIYFNLYEHFESYKTNVRELNQRWGGNARIGEWGEDLKDGNVAKDDWWQREELEKRWNVIKEETKVPVAYIFSYREPSYDGFGIVSPHGKKRPVWEVLGNAGERYSIPNENVVNALHQIVVPTTVPSEDSKKSDTISTKQVVQPIEAKEEYVPSARSSTIGNYKVTCEVGSGNCDIVKDDVIGVCRTIEMNTPEGLLVLKACEKSGSSIEVYRHVYPEGLDFEACLGNGCVDSIKGFDRFGNEQQESSSSTSGVNSLKLSTTSGRIVNDYDENNGCRRISAEADNAHVEARICEKDSGYEMYKLSSSGDLDICHEESCVGKTSGFAHI